MLIADDEPDVRLMLRLQLERAGHEVTGEATDGAQACELCAEDPPDLVLLDLLMPGVSGFEAIPRLRSSHPDVPIVAFTAVAGDVVRQEMARLGIPLVLKTGNFSQLEAALAAAVAGRG